jgi:carboxymethylenebutenolidase
MSDDRIEFAEAVREHLDSHQPSMKLNRRGFVSATLSTGFALAVSPVQAQTAIRTPADGLTAGPVRIPVKEGEIPAYRAMPQGKTGLATILVVSEIWGVHEYIQDVCRRLAKLGYLAVAPELFVRLGDIGKAESIAAIMRDFVSRTPVAQVMGDLDATAAWAARNGGDPGRLGVTGFCWGGQMTLMYAAHNPKLSAAVAWYGVLSAARVAGDRTVLEVASTIKVPVLGLFGGKDGGIPVSDVDKLREQLKAGGNRQSEIVVYPDAGHAFHADYRPSYVKEAADDGWKRMADWFKSHGLG